MDAKEEEGKAVRREDSDSRTESESEDEVDEDEDEGEERVREPSRRLAESDSGVSQSTVAAQSETLNKWKNESRLQGKSVSGQKFKEKVGMSHQELLASVTARAALVNSQNQLQSATCTTASPELSPTSVTQPISSVASSEEKRALVPIVVRTPESSLHVSADLRASPASPSVKSSRADGYNWRKYGQKQVKCPEGSRSYFRCTYLDCSAKKIECFDPTGHVTETVYRSPHNHGPPRNSNKTKESIPTIVPIENSSNSEHPVRMPVDSEQSTASKEQGQEVCVIPERNGQNSAGVDPNGKVAMIKEHVKEGGHKRSGKKSDSSHSDPPLTPGKKPKFVVHAAGDVGISSDGYRWRKYGQKMVKGNPHPRNYYRCTSAGCPVRKHIETAVNNASGVVITYKGVHDHDMPVPKKRHGPPSAALVAASAPASTNLPIMKVGGTQKETDSVQWSVDKEGELTKQAMDLGGEKAIESARTLLSIGFEIKPC